MNTVPDLSVVYSKTISAGTLSLDETTTISPTLKLYAFTSTAILLV